MMSPARDPTSKWPLDCHSAGQQAGNRVNEEVMDPSRATSLSISALCSPSPPWGALPALTGPVLIKGKCWSSHTAPYWAESVLRQCSSGRLRRHKAHKKKACLALKGSKKTPLQIIRMVWCPNSIFQADKKLFLHGRKRKACEQMPGGLQHTFKKQEEKEEVKKSACILSSNQLKESLYHWISF